MLGPGRAMPVHFAGACAQRCHALCSLRYWDPCWRNWLQRHATASPLRCLSPQVPINSSALREAISFSAAQEPFNAADWSPLSPPPRRPRVPLPMPGSSGGNPLKRASAAWWANQGRVAGDGGQPVSAEGAASAGGRQKPAAADPSNQGEAGGGDTFGTAVWGGAADAQQPPRPQPPRRACPAGLEGKCPATLRRSQAKLRLRRA